MTIPILMTTDDKYIDQVIVAIYSVCENTSLDNEIEVTMLCDVSLMDCSRNKLLKLCDCFSNLKISFYEVNPLLFINATTDYYVPIATFYRLICPDVIDCPKAIFLDSDLVVDMDIAELFATDVEDYYLAGVRDIYPILYPNFAYEYARDYSFENFKDYINCGVLLMNLDGMRRDGLVERFIDGLKDKNLFVDQDILNRVCHGNIKLLPWRFNYTPRSPEEEFEILLGCERGVGGEVVHYCGKEKPWGSRKCYRGVLWWDYAKKALSDDDYDKLIRARDVCYGKMSVYEFAEKCKNKGGPVVIVGYSSHGQFVRHTLKKYGIKDEILFGDNNPKKRQLLLGSDDVKSVEELAEGFKENIWINAVQEHREEVNDQLHALGISDENIVQYYSVEDNGCDKETIHKSYEKWLAKRKNDDNAQ